MTRTSIVFASVSIFTATSIGCGEVPADTDSETSALVGAPIRGVRGYTRNDGVHGVVYKSLRTGGVDETLDTIGTNVQPHDLPTAQVLNTPSPLKRTDNANAIAFISTDQHFHEVSQSGTSGVWTDFDFHTSFGINAPLAANSSLNDSNAYIRTDGKNIYIYRGSNNHIIEIASNFGSSPPWVASDLTAFTGAPNANGAIVPYVRADNVNALVYTATDGHVHEISSTPGSVTNWFDNDLFIASGLSLVSFNDPWGYKRFDNTNAVVFNDGVGNLREITLTSGTFCGGLPWCNRILATDVSRSFGRPSGYVRWANRDAVVFISSSNSLNEVSHVINQPWFEGTIQVGSLSGGEVSLTGASQLFGHRAPGSFDSVLFEAQSSLSGTDPFEMYLGLTGGWHFEHVDTF